MRLRCSTQEVQPTLGRVSGNNDWFLRFKGFGTHDVVVASEQNFSGSSFCPVTVYTPVVQDRLDLVTETDLFLTAADQEAGKKKNCECSHGNPLCCNGREGECTHSVMNQVKLLHLQIFQQLIDQYCRPEKSLEETKHSGPECCCLL